MPSAPEVRSTAGKKRLNITEEPIGKLITKWNIHTEKLGWRLLTAFRLFIIINVGETGTISPQYDDKENHCIPESPAYRQPAGSNFITDRNPFFVKMCRIFAWPYYTAYRHIILFPPQGRALRV